MSYYPAPSVPADIPGHTDPAPVVTDAVVESRPTGPAGNMRVGDYTVRAPDMDTAVAVARAQHGGRFTGTTSHKTGPDTYRVTVTDHGPAAPSNAIPAACQSLTLSGICDLPTDSRGYCDRPRDHVDG